MAELKQETIELGGREVVLTELPATARTVRMLTPFLSKGRGGAASLVGMVDAIAASLAYTYDEEEVDEILDLIPFVPEDGESEEASAISKIADIIFRGLK